MRELEIVLAGGDRIHAVYRDITVETDQDGTAPAPFDLFLVSIGTCAGLYVARFCQQRGIPTDNIRIRQRMLKNPESRMIDRIEIEVELPPDFPERYRVAVQRAAELCSVKKHLQQPPAIEVRTRVADTAASRLAG